MYQVQCACEGEEHMTYEEFLNFVPAKCMYETIYEDSEGREILVISLLDAYGMVNKAQREWQGLTEGDKSKILQHKWWNFEDEFDLDGLLKMVEAKIKQKNT
jgi:hypothetical protein